MKFRNFPTITALIAGLVVVIFTIINRYTIEKTLIILACSMAGFYILGLVFKKLLNITAADTKKGTGNDEAEAEEGSETAGTAGVESVQGVVKK